MLHRLAVMRSYAYLVCMCISDNSVCVSLAYAVTFNKPQGKTLTRAVVDIRCQAFTHGQLYVALRRVKRSADRLILCTPSSVLREVGADGVVYEFVVATNVVERVALKSSMSAGTV